MERLECSPHSSILSLHNVCWVWIVHLKLPLLLATSTFSIVKNSKYRDILVITVILAIKDKWPDCIHNMSIQQQGGPPARIKKWRRACYGSNDRPIELKLKLHSRESADDVNMMIILSHSTGSAVEERTCRCHWRSDPTRKWGIWRIQSSERNYGFLTLQCWKFDISLAYGNKNFKIRHIDKLAPLHQVINALNTSINAKQCSAKDEQDKILLYWMKTVNYSRPTLLWQASILS